MICRMGTRDDQSGKAPHALIEARLLEAYGIRVEPEMSRYIARQLEQAGKALREVAVIGGEAKTGAPRRMMIDPATLQPARPPRVTM
jgi:hypothetical protein